MRRHLWRKHIGVLVSLVIIFTAILPQSAVTVKAADSTDSAVAAALSSYNNLGVAVVSDFLNVRKSASSSSKILGVMQNKDVCEVLSTSGSWYKVKSGTVKGYVYSKYLATGEEAVSIATSVIVKGSALTTAAEVSSNDTSSDSIREELVTYAKKFVGNPYKWGGTSLTKGADCSGFTLSVYAKYGVTLPHSSSLQSKYGKKVSLSKIKAGDLLFYGSGKSISHVAIYIGNGKIVHAANAKSGIKISNAYYSTPICAVSLLN